MNRGSVVCLLILALVALSFAKEQRINVRGKVICNKRAEAHVSVELREHDTFDPDDSLAKTKTNDEGYFEISGTESEITSIKPYLRILHKCDVEESVLSDHNHERCHRVSDYLIPEKAINAGQFDLQFINLNIHGHSDKKICD